MKPRVRLSVGEFYSGVQFYICIGWLPNGYQQLATPGRTVEEAARLWYQVRDIYMGVPL